ncbi:MAG TPA: hypothetical protein VFX58_20645 [Chitinophagaceae bacterium]|nr:hypothetical protein [Chitinophagaceae bacterium]
MKRNVSPLTGLLLILGLLGFSCQKETVNGDWQRDTLATADNSNKAANEKRIYVSNLEELYAAVNNPDNAGSRVILAPGVYVLDAGYPNGGRLELQRDMTLQGQAGEPAAVLIDESSLPASSFQIPSASTGGIRLGRGTNILEWLSVKGVRPGINGFSVIETDLPSSEAFIEISHVHVNVNGNRIGINIRNRLGEHAGRKIYAKLEHNEVFGAVNFFGFGLMAVNINGASNSLIQISMRGNYVYGNKVGFIVNNAAQSSNLLNSRIEITSHADRFEGNGVALDPSGGVNSGSSTVANNNSTYFKIYGTSLRNNNPDGQPQLLPLNGALPGAIYAACGYNSVNSINGYNRVSNNILKMELFGCDISNNNGTDINAYAAWCPPAAVLAGTNNLVDLHLHGVSALATVEAVHSSPAEPAGTNVVSVYRN